ncbi:phBC6A51 family helix-turn-helix protein [Cohnella sp.]|uniref:phBC6A51 family helix-turn-helix protein n=1 Tax=Cohnella sp. TaxID=1883426 RepID=UPI003563F896
MRQKKRPFRRLPLDERHYRAIELLAGLRDNYGDVAQAIGVSRMTLYRYRKRADFRRELRKATAKLLNAQHRELKRRFALITNADVAWLLQRIEIV